MKLKKQTTLARPTGIKGKLAMIAQNYDLYLMLIPGLVYLIIFKYLPMYGISIAFQDFNLFKGISGSEWVGFENFRKLMRYKDFYNILRNTLVISVLKIVITFPLPIVAALLLNEMRNMIFKRTLQTIIYIPHFLSWVVIAGIFTSILSPSSGLLNIVLAKFGIQPISFMMSPKWFRPVLVFTSAWKETGYSAVIYIAAIAGIDQAQYEAAEIDGAGRFRQMLHITLPGISSTIVLLLTLKLGSILNAGTEQILMMYNPTVYNVGDVIGTYVYRMGIGQQQYGTTTAVGLFNGVVGFILVVSGNFISRRLTGKSIW